MKTLKSYLQPYLSKVLFVVAAMAAALLISLPAYAKTCTDTSCGTNTSASGSTVSPTSLQSNPIVKDLNDIVDFLSAGVGIIVVAMLITGGIQYSMAGGSSDAVSKAKDRISNALIALVLYLLIFGFLQWIVPGGLFNS